MLKLSKEAKALLLLFILAYSCKEKSNKIPIQLNKKFEKQANDTLLKYGLQNYLDSAYWYTYIYFGGLSIKACGTVDIDSVLPDTVKRKVVYQDLIVTKVRMLTDSSFLFLSVVPLINDSIMSCNMVSGPQLPHEILFNYKSKTFVQFVYDDNGWLRLDANPIEDYENGLKKILDNDAKYDIEPNKKFRTLLTKISNKS